MANLQVLDGAAASKYLKASGAGDSGDPHIVEHLETNSAAIKTAAELIDNIVHAEDVAAASGDGLAGAGFVRKDTIGADAADGDWVYGQTNSKGQVRTETGLVQVTVTTVLTRPADTNAYAAGDSIADSTSAPTVLTFANCARYNGGAGYVIGAVMIDSANQTTLGSYDLFLLDTTWTPDNDNAVITPTDAELATCVGKISFSSGLATIGDATSGAGGNVLYTGTISGGRIPFVCEASSTSLFGIFTPRNAYTPVSAETFTFRLMIIQH